MKRFGSKNAERLFVDLNETHLVDDLLRDIVLDVRRDIIVDLAV